MREPTSKSSLRQHGSEAFERDPAHSVVPSMANEAIQVPFAVFCCTPRNFRCTGCCCWAPASPPASSPSSSPGAVRSSSSPAPSPSPARPSSPSLLFPSSPIAAPPLSSWDPVAEAARCQLCWGAKGTRASCRLPPGDTSSSLNDSLSSPSSLPRSARPAVVGSESADRTANLTRPGWPLPGERIGAIACGEAVVPSSYASCSSSSSGFAAPAAAPLQTEAEQEKMNARDSRHAGCLVKS